MATNLRDLDADRRYCRPEDSAWDTPTEIRLKNIAIAALDEIERLKRLLVFKSYDGYDALLKGQRVGPYPTDSDAWAAVRKAALELSQKDGQ